MPIPAETIIDYLRERAGRPLKAKELAKGLGISTAEYGEFRALLSELERKGLLYRARSQRYAAPERINLVIGELRMTRSGAGFVVPEDSETGGDDLYIPAQSLESAVDRDRVVARVEHQRRGQRREGSIIKVLERARETVVGTYHPEAGFGFVVPEDRKLARNLFIPPGQEGGATGGELVVVRVTSWGNHHLGPSGEVETVLGKATDPGVDILAVIYGHGLPLDFPRSVLDEADSIGARGLSAEEFEGRTDLRELHLFTIDPEDARDFDDALSIQPLEEGVWEVGVHIADIGHYVREDSPLDREAFRRGTSIYLVDRVIPMLPATLSNDLGSLRPGEDRLALSLILRVAPDGGLLDHQLVRSIIRSRHRISYEEAQAVIDGSGTIDAETDESIRGLIEVSRKLRALRIERGSLDFDLPEARVVLGGEGEPIDIQKIQRLESHQLIEDFMLLANETIASESVRRGLPMIYRIHEGPDRDRIEQLSDFVATFGHRLSKRGDPTPKEIQRLLDRTRGRPEEELISTVVLRSMKQARYSPENSGHFGLAAPSYLHFTSPIRRYPDLMVHRLVARTLIDGERPDPALDEEALATVARVASERERVAIDAERDSVALKKVEFMESRVGETFAGTISGVTAFGFFVLLDDYFVEGLVHVSWLTDDYYLFIEEQFSLVGERTRRRFQLGDRVVVEVTAVNREERTIDFHLVESESDSRRNRGRKGGRSD